MLFYQTYKEINQIFNDATIPFVQGVDEWKKTLRYPDSIDVQKIEANALLPVFGLIVVYTGDTATISGGLGGLLLSSRSGRWIYLHSSATKEETRGKKFTSFGQIDTRKIQEGCDYVLRKVQSHYNPRSAEQTARYFKQSPDVLKL